MILLRDPDKQPTAVLCAHFVRICISNCGNRIAGVDSMIQAPSLAHDSVEFTCFIFSTHIRDRSIYSPGCICGCICSSQYVI